MMGVGIRTELDVERGALSGEKFFVGVVVTMATGAWDETGGDKFDLGSMLPSGTFPADKTLCIRPGFRVISVFTRELRASSDRGLARSAGSDLMRLGMGSPGSVFTSCVIL